MREILIDNEEGILNNTKAAIAIGKFDGLHRGHKEILKRLSEYKKRGCVSMVVTFDKSFSAFFKGESEGSLMTMEEKRLSLEAEGVDIMAVYPVNADSVRLSAEDFLEKVLIKRLGARAIAAGADVSFGYRGLGNAELLREYSQKTGLECCIVDKVYDDEGKREISSSYIRELVAAGRVNECRRLMDGGFFLTRSVVHGQGLGHKFLFPTINQPWPKDKLLPPLGVYYSRVYIDDKEYYGITNIGKKPTVLQGEEPGAETYILDFEGDIYGERVTLEFLEFARPEKKFSSLEELKKALVQDISGFREWIKKS